jgi:hypothetical protein
MLTGDFNNIQKITQIFHDDYVEYKVLKDTDEFSIKLDDVATSLEVVDGWLLFKRFNKQIGGLKL